MRTGAEVLAVDGFRLLRGLRLGVLCNPASLVRTRSGGAPAAQGRGPGARRLHLVDAMVAAGCDVVRLFGPEHGLWSTAQDLIAVEGGRDPVFDREVTTLYGRTVDTLAVKPQALDGIEALVFDVQDVGSRYYTYFATLCMAIDTCAARGVPVIVLDRPNPLGGEVVEGGRVDPSYRSFVGWLDLPQRHGLTIAEIARLHVAEAGLPPDCVRAISCDGWNPEQYYDEQDWGADGSPWYAPSPNMPTVATAVVYPGACLIEGTRLSEGRGSTRPFELVGAPWLDARQYAEAIDALGVAGLAVRPMRFEPTFQKFAGQVVEGVAVEVCDRRRFTAVRAGLALIAAARGLNPERFAWRTETYEFVSDRLAIDLLMGGPQARRAIEAGEPIAACAADFAAAEAEFGARATSALLYRRQSGRHAPAA